MKIVMFTPTSRASAIGRVTGLVVRALVAQGHDVHIVSTDLERPSDSHRFPGDVIHWTEDVRVVSTLLGADVGVYQIGDHYPFHAGALRWLPAIPGVVCLHDHFVGHLFEGWAHANGLDVRPTVAKWYGDDVAERFAAEWRHLELDERAQLAPMTEWICAQAIGVLTHSPWALDRVLASCAGPVGWAPLPYELARVPAEPSNAHPGWFRVLTVGHMNPNKRVASVIRAIGSDENLRARVAYKLAGPITPVEEAAVRELAASEGVELDVVGRVTDSELAGALIDAHVVAALRWPCLEAASASVIEAMLSGKATIVTRTAFYDTLPDDCVIKIDHDREVEQVADALRSLVANRTLASALGERARSYALANHRAEPYAETLVDLARDALVAAPVLGAVRTINETLGRWGAVSGIGDEFVFEPLRSLVPDQDAASI